MAAPVELMKASIAMGPADAFAPLLNKAHRTPWRPQLATAVAQDDE